ncbi:hypothetical protein RE6C_03142 [Rhodopirellula europaea 6C]|uniref:Uncharacterized protein n=1 Tax=Rhodopirellula europaea 6C TaxID=1263867 RepID=M2B2X0_9BACT|nr:hypothetical protein RE6C_03142 [Rhodopirellula europaea 6C]
MQKLAAYFLRRQKAGPTSLDPRQPAANQDAIGHSHVAFTSY